MNRYQGMSGICRGFGMGALALIAAGALTFSSRAQSFQNLDFENPGTQLAPDGIWLSWSMAVPGWTHPSGGDSLFVYHHTPPLASIAQFYFLVDQYSTEWSPLDGTRSLALVSGHYNRNDDNSPWVQAYIEQSGFVPEEAQSFHLLATANVSLSVNGEPVTLSRSGEKDYWADMTSYAGQYVSLRIGSEATAVQDPVIVDRMSFSTQPIPEPGTAALALLGLGVFVTRKFRSRKIADR